MEQSDIEENENIFGSGKIIHILYNKNKEITEEKVVTEKDKAAIENYLKSYANKDKVINIANLDLSGYCLVLDGLKLKSLYINNVNADDIYQTNHKAKCIYQQRHTAEHIIQSNHLAYSVRQTDINANTIYNSQKIQYEKKYHKLQKEYYLQKKVKRLTLNQIEELLGCGIVVVETEEKSIN